MKRIDLKKDTSKSSDVNICDLKISVTELVQFSAREGDLFHEDLLGPDAQAGLRGHQSIQKSRSQEWQAEYALSYAFYRGAGTITVGGRIDLINTESQPIIFEEIKTCFGPGHLQPPERKALHWAQLKIYAALYCYQYSGLEEVDLRVSYFDLQSQQISMEEERFHSRSLKDFCEQCLDKYWRWWCLLQAQKDTLRHYCRALRFPFQGFREGQRALAEDVYRSLRDAVHLLIDAPTGTGKTLSVLFPALKAFGENQVQQLLYLTTKGSAQLNALDALKCLVAANGGAEKEESKSGLDVLVLQARDKACPCLSADASLSASCKSERGLCSRTLGFYDRLPAAREAALEMRCLTVENIQKLAAHHHICPFAFSIHMLPWMSLVIGDINYFFDPLVRLSAFETQARQRAVLIDEAHNLPSRSRDMYSAELNSAELAQVIKNLPKALGYLKRPMKKLLQTLRSVDGELTDSQALPEAFSWQIFELMRSLQQSGDNGFAGGLLGAETHAYRSWVKQLYRWVAIYRLRTEAHCLLLNESGARDAKKEKSVQLRCLDAAEFIGPFMEQVRSSILFSSTLKPFAYSVQQLGLDGATKCLSVSSRFLAENQLNVICRFVETEWQRREASQQALIELITTVVSAKPGKYLVFFPSFAYLQQVVPIYRECYPDQELLVQEADFDDLTRAEFIDSFKNGSGPLLGFAVVGGVFSEGVDFAGDSLIGAIVIGTGMPQPSDEQQRMSAYFAKKGLNAFRYAYLYPGFIRLLQTAGRVIRSENDRGIVVFVEPRLIRSEYSALFPKHWKLEASHSHRDLEEKLKKFWRRK